MAIKRSKKSIGGLGDSEAGTGGVASGRRRISYIEDSSVYTAIEKMAGEEYLTVSDIVRRAVRNYVQDNQKKG